MAEWSIGQKIGKGSFASVYSGTHKVSALALLPWYCLRRPTVWTRDSSFEESTS